VIFCVDDKIIFHFTKIIFSEKVCGFFFKKKAIRNAKLMALSFVYMFF